jgi:hypothetical protein
MEQKHAVARIKSSLSLLPSHHEFHFATTLRKDDDECSVYNGQDMSVTRTIQYLVSGLSFTLLSGLTTSYVPQETVSRDFDVPAIFLRLIIHTVQRCRLSRKSEH